MRTYLVWISAALLVVGCSDNSSSQEETQDLIDSLNAPPPDPEVTTFNISNADAVTYIIRVSTVDQSVNPAVFTAQDVCNPVPGGAIFPNESECTNAISVTTSSSTIFHWLDLYDSLGNYLDGNILTKQNQQTVVVASISNGLIDVMIVLP